MKFRPYTITFLILTLLWASNFAYSQSEIKEATLAITAFENQELVARLDPLQRALPRMLTTDLSFIKGIRILERARLEKFLEERNLSALGLLDPGTRQKLGEALGADYLLGGRFRPDGSDLIVELTMHDVLRRRTVDLTPARGKQNRLLELESELFENICQHLNLDSTSRKKIPEKRTKRLLHLAILDFENFSLSGELNLFTTELPALLAEKLSSADNIALVERSEIQRILAELELSRSGMVSQKDAVLTGKILGADLVLLGCFLKVDSYLRVDTQLVHTESGVVVATETITEKPENLETLLQKTSARILLDTSLPFPSGIKPSLITMTLEAKFYYDKAHWFWHRGRHAEAINEFEKVLFLDPNHVEAKMALAEVYSEIGREDKALEIYQEVIKRTPAYFTFFGPRPLLRLIEFYQEKRNEKAIDMSRQLVEKCTDFWCTPHERRNAYEDLAMSLVAIGQVKEANHLAERLRKNPTVDGMVYYYGLGKAWEKKGDFEKALGLYNEAFDIYKRLSAQIANEEKEITKYYYRRRLHARTAGIHYKRKEYRKAFGEYQKLSPECYDLPENPTLVASWLSRLFLLLGRPEDVAFTLKEVEEILKSNLKVEHPWRIAELGTFYREQNRYNEAIELYSEYLEALAAPESSPLYKTSWEQHLTFETARCYEAKSDVETALKTYKRAFDLNPHETTTHFAPFLPYRASMRIAKLSLEKEDFPQAIFWYRRALTRRRDTRKDAFSSVSIHEKIGDSYRGLGQFSLAAYEYKKALRLADNYRLGSDTRERLQQKINGVKICTDTKVRFF